MARFLIDVNLPYKIGIWNRPDFIHVANIDERWTDSQIWEFAQEGGFVIVSKDADFTNRASISTSSPKIIHICLGNCSLKALHLRIAEAWPWVEQNIEQCKMVRIFSDRIEATLD